MTRRVSEFVDTGGGVPPENVAVTDTALVVTSTEQIEPAELEHPDQKTVAPVLAVAVKVNVCSGAVVPEQVCGPGPHVTPPPDTVPFPLTEIENGTSGSKSAVTSRVVSICTVHVVCVPEHGPPQPAKP